MLRDIMERVLWCLLRPGEKPLAMHGILGVRGSAKCAFSLQLFITGIRRGAGTMVLCGPIQGPVLKPFSNRS